MATNPFDEFQPATPANPFDEFDRVGPTTRQVLHTAVRTNPDDAAEVARLAKRYPGPNDVLLRSLKDVKLQEAVDKADESLKTSVKLSEYMRTSPFAAQQAHDDLGTLAQLERFATDTYGSVEAGVFNASKGAAGVFRAASELAAPVLDFLEAETPEEFAGWRGSIGGNPLRRLAEGFALQGAGAGAQAKAAAPKTEGALEGGFQSGIQSLTQNLLALPMAFLPGGQPAALTMMTASTGGQSYQDAREKGLPMSQALPFAASQAAIEYATEKLPLAQLLGDVKAGTSFIKTLAKQVALEVPGEQVATILQDMNEWAVLNPEKPFSSYLAERPSAAAQTLVATIVGAGGNVAVAKGIETAVSAVSGTAARMRYAENEAQKLQDALAVAAQSKLRERNPETFRDLAANLTDDAKVFVDAQVLAQSAAELAQALPAVAEQLEAAIATNSTIEIPVADILTLAPGTPLEQVFLQNARQSPDAMSLADVTQAGEQAQQFLQQEAERVMQQAQDQQAWQASSEAVKTTILDQLNQAGRFSADVNEAYAALQMNFFSTMAARLGTTPQELYDRYSLKVAQQTPGQGNVLNAMGDQTQIPEFQAWFGDSKVVTADGQPLMLFRGMAGEGMPDEGVSAMRPTTGLLGTGIYLTGYPRRAEGYTRGEKGQTYPLYASIQNPISEDDFIERFGRTRRTPEENQAITDQLIAEGYDGIIADRGPGNLWEVVAFRPEQVKSVFNARPTGAQDILNQSVSTRLPTAKKALENPLEQMLVIGLDAAKADPKAFEKNVELIRQYPNFRDNKSASTPDKAAEQFIRHVVDNLLWLYDQVPAETRERSKLWYDGARSIVDRWVPKYDVTDAQAAGMLAVLSPQKDWFQNVSLAERVLDVMSTKQDFAWSDEMSQTAAGIGALSVEDVGEITGKTLGEIDSDYLQAIWVRVYDQTYNERGYRVVSPEGDFTDWVYNADGTTKSKTAWGSFNEIGKAISIYKDGSIANISASLGEQHKVRNFYNNIFNPASQHGDVTIDTHAVAAGLLRPLSGSAIEVVHNFGAGGAASSSVFGSKGTYGIYAEAYRRAAEQRGVLPREMQSITWEAVRGLYTAGFKSQASNVAKIDAIWENYKKRKVSLDDARNQLLEAAGRINPPEWERPGAGAPATAWASSYTGELRQDGGPAGAAGRGDGGLPADAAAGVLNQAPRLMAVHNLTAENLAFADRMGGLAVPSIGVVTEGAGSVEGFGEITLIGRKDLVDPARERVFSSDAYTARFPKPEWPKAKTKDATKLVDSVRAAAKEFDDRSLTDQTWDYMVDNPDANRLVELWMSSNAVKAMFLREQGVDAQPVRKPVSMSSGLTVEQFEQLRPLYETVRDQENNSDYNTPEAKELTDRIEQMLRANYAERGVRKVLANKFISEITARPTLYLYRDERAAREGPPIDTWETSKRLSGEIDSRAFEFKQWVESKVLANFGEPFIKVGRQKAPYTLSNIVEAMTDTKVKGKEKTMTYGAGQVRAASSVEFSDLEQMRAAAEQSIVDQDAYNAAKEQTEKKLEDYRKAVVDFTKLRDWRGNPDIFEAMDASMRALAKWSTSKKRDATSMKAALRGEDFDVAAIPTEVITQAMEAAGALLQAPVPYFEAKPQRAVNLGEFAGAVIPANAPQQVRDILAKYDIRVTEYAPDSDRTAIAREFSAQLAGQGQDTLFQGPRGTFNPQTLLLTLNKNADLSTFLHESGHFFLEVMADLASQPDAPQQIVDDMAATLKWFGVPDLATWNGYTLDQKRPYHEKWAESFEQYLFEGRAPSTELQPLFRRFRSWMVNVYKTLTQFMRGRDLKLGDDIRQVFDRLIATDEQIAQAEQAAGLLPDFDATNEAIEKLQARSLRDLKWAINARNKTIKALQKEAENLRREARKDARDEVLAHPLYAAYRFLTARLSKTDREFIKPVPAPKSVDGPVDESIDSLFVAIAKLGGLKRDEVESQWGWDKKERTPTPLFGKPLLRREGGLSIDAMAQRLAEYGYLAVDEDGAFDPADFEAAFDSEYRGAPVYAYGFDYSRAQEEPRPGEGATLATVGASRLDLTALRQLDVPDAVIAKLTERGMTAENGMHPDIVADMFEFDSGAELARYLADALPLSAEIEGTADRLMLMRHGDLIDQRAIEQAANEAVHNEARARALATELKAQSDMMNQRQDTGRTDTRGRPITVNAITAAAKEFAANLAARRRIKDLKNAAWQHRSAEARAGKAWQEATAKGDTQAAVQAKRDQVLNNAAAKALQDAQAETRKILEFFKRVAKGNDEKVVKGGRDPDVVNAMRAILGAYDIAPRLEKAALEYMETVSRNDPAMFAALQPSVQGAINNAKPLPEMTMEELRGLNDELRAMWALAKRSRQMEIDGNLLDRQDLADALLARMTDIGIPAEIPGERAAITDREEAGIKLQFAKSILSRVEQWAERMDGKFGGPFLRFVFQPIKEAADTYRTARVDYRKRFTALVENVGPAIRPGSIPASEIGYTFGNSRDSGQAELLHAILHTGNESNKRKLLLGRGWATENPDGTLDTSRWDAFIQRMHDSGVLRKEHYDFAQGVWDLLEEMKPLAQETHRNVFGRYFAEVTANAFETPFGSYRGGYVPAQTDALLVRDAKLRELAEGENETMAYAFPSAPSGFTKARVEYNKPLLLDLRALAQHIDKVLLFSYMQGPVTDVRRLLTDKGVAYALDRIDPGAYEGMLIPWLNRSARQIVETPVAGDRKLSRFLSAARSRAGMALMFANLSNTFQQITGFSMAAVKVKPSLMLKATAEFTRSPKQMKEQVAAASEFMRNRMLNEIGAMNDAVEQILVDATKLEKAQAWTREHAYFLQAAVDNTMSPIIWTAAYNQAIEQQMTHKDAVRFADGVIRQTQGTTLPEDISRFESGSAIARTFTQFVGYFNMMANTNATAAKQVIDEVGLRKGAGRLLGIALAGLLVPIWVAEAIAQAFRGGPDDEDDDGYLDDWLMAVFGMGTLRGMVAQVPIVGQMAQLAVNRFNSNPADDKFSLSPAVSLIESAVSSPASVYKAIVDEGSAQKAVRDVAAAATLITGLPVYGAARPLGYLAGVADDRIEPTGPIDFTRGLVTGTASPESKAR